MAGRKPVAEQALKLLWDETIAAEGNALACRPGDGAVIGRNLISLVAGDPFAYFCTGSGVFPPVCDKSLSLI